MNLIKVGFEKQMIFPMPDEGRKFQLPEWYYYPPFGQPRNVDITRIRELAEQPWINACVTSLVDKFASLDWDIVPKDNKNYNEEERQMIKEFFLSPNQNGETIHNIMKKWAKDLLEIDASVIVKVFSKGSYGNESSKSIVKSVYINDKLERREKTEKKFKPLNKFGKRELSEIYCIDGSTFLAETDVSGFINGWYQYSFKLPKSEPIMFDVNEICYSMRYPRSDRPYGWSPVQSIEKIVLTLKSQVEYFLDFFKERAVPDGILSILESNRAEMERLVEHWKKETIGRKHKFAILGRDVKFTPLTITSRDMEILTTQQWFSKMVMAMYRLNIPILSLKGEAPKAGLESLRRSEMADALKPLMQEWDAIMDNNIIPEFLQVEKEKCKYEWKFNMYDLEEDERTRAMQREDVNSRIITINEVREERGLEPVAWGNEPIVPISPFGQDSQNQQDSQNLQDDKKKDYEKTINKFVGLEFGIVNQDMLDYVKNYDFSLIDTSEENRKKIKEMFIRAIKESWTLYEIEKKLKSILKDDADEGRIDNIIRTETIRMSSESSLNRYERNGIKKVRWIATPSSQRACEECIENHMKEFTLDEARGKIPLHSQCRCSFLPVI